MLRSCIRRRATVGWPRRAPQKRTATTVARNVQWITNAISHASNMVERGSSGPGMSGRRIVQTTTANVTLTTASSTRREGGWKAVVKR